MPHYRRLFRPGATYFFTVVTESRAPILTTPLARPLLHNAIAECRLDVLVFFWDPLEAQPHDPDVKALLRIAVMWNIPVANNRVTADHLFSSPLMTAAYERTVPTG